ncbi:MAG: EF-P lysine aminoacylase GenX [Candidatus Magasanikbacteria bacterium]|nr:EF-P lysine aminoacylase GenX [Candidatus Magasanikbacteria bacterium]
MEHVAHISKNKQTLELRFAILKLIREWFWSQGFTEVETPNIVKVPGQEPYLSPMPVKLHNEQGEEFFGYLHTSPEYTMKKMLAAGFDKIFSLGKCYRDYESFGGTHNPEFTMLEWYRVESDYKKIMEDVEELIGFIIQKLMEHRTLNMEHRTKDLCSMLNAQCSIRVSMSDLWEKFVEVDLDECLTSEAMLRLCREKKYDAKDSESYEDLFYRIFLNEIEPKLKEVGGIIIYDYPAKLAALSRLSASDPRYAERFEVYVNGIELANAFSELTDTDEQLKRLKEEQELRRKLGKEVYNIDEEFLLAVGQMPKSAGIALGVDRLVQIIAALRHGSPRPELGTKAGQVCKNIDDVITLPASKLF